MKSLIGKTIVGGLGGMAVGGTAFYDFHSWVFAGILSALCGIGVGLL